MQKECFIQDDYRISKNKSLLQFERIVEMLQKTYWASNRSKAVIQKSIENSMCFGLYFKDVQVGFARVISDYATAYYICDVVIDEDYRGKGLGKKLVGEIVDDGELESLFGMLITKDAHGLYEHYGFQKDGKMFMFRR